MQQKLTQWLPASCSPLKLTLDLDLWARARRTQRREPWEMQFSLAKLAHQRTALSYRREVSLREAGSHAQAQMASKAHSVWLLSLLLTQAPACWLWGLSYNKSWAELQLQHLGLGMSLGRETCGVEENHFRVGVFRTSLKAQWLRCHTSNAGDSGLIPDQGTKIPHVTWPKKKEREWESVIVLTHLCSIELS